GFSLRGRRGRSVVRVRIELVLSQPGTPITGRALVPRGTTVDVSMPTGHQLDLGNGRFSIPTSLSGVGGRPSTTLVEIPKKVVAGKWLEASGEVGGRCAEGAPVTLSSRAFRGSHLTAGVPAVKAVVGEAGAFLVRTRIPGDRSRGRYVISARCGARKLGITAGVAVVPRSRRLGEPVPPDTCASGQYNVYVCLVVHNYTHVTLTLANEWQSCGRLTPAPQALAPGQQESWKVDCLINFWGGFQYQISTGTVNESYSTFSGTASCGVGGFGFAFADCTAGNSMTPTNPFAHGENWHYELFVAIDCRPAGTRRGC
ncbi:MAG: hypothetical protein ACR2ND_01565, partial [Solirubrobacteraceae bacterium]